MGQQLRSAAVLGNARLQPGVVGLGTGKILLGGKDDVGIGSSDLLALLAAPVSTKTGRPCGVRGAVSGPRTENYLPR